MPLMLEIHPVEGPVSRIGLQPGLNRFSVRVGETFRIVDAQTGLTPAGASVRRLDQSLVVDGLLQAEAPAIVEFAGFYTMCSAGSPCQLELQETAGAAPISITPGTAPIGALADGSFVLHDPGYVASPSLPAAGGVDIRTVLYGVGGLAIAGLALGGGGGGGGGSGGGDAPTAVSGTGGGPAAADSTLKLTSPLFVNSRMPTLAGEGEPGSRVIVRIDTDNDGVPNVGYGVTVGSDFRWSLDLATATPESGALPAGGLPLVSTVGITATSAGGNISLPPFRLAFDDVAPAPAVVDPVAVDNRVNAAEEQAGVHLSGSAEPGGTVHLSWGGQAAAAAVDADGRWQATFAAAVVPADGVHPVVAQVQDPAGNLAPPTQVAVTIDTVAPALALASAAGGDGVVAIVDASSVGFNGTGEAGAQVTVQWNGFDRSVTADPGGRWAVGFLAAEVPAVAAGLFPYAITAADAAGNVASATGEVLVDRQAPAPPIVGVVEGDNQVSPAERADGVVLAGTTEPGASVLVQWAGASKPALADGDGAWRVGFAPDELPRVASPGADTVVTVTATDAVGNIGTPASAIVFVQQPFPPPTITVVAGDDVVNLRERAAGVTLGGSVHPGAPGVTVTWGSFSGAAPVAGGTWQLVVPPQAVPEDGATAAVVAIAGFPEISQSRNLRIDTTPPAPPALAAVAGDNRVSLAERADGVRVTGTAEAGASVRVEWNGVLQRASAGGDGHWAVDFEPGQVPATAAGGGNTAITATATDPAGNTGAAAGQTVFVEQPFDAPVIHPVEGDDVVSSAERSDGVVLSGTVQAGAPGVHVAWGGFSGSAAVSGSAWSLLVGPAQVPGDGDTPVIATVAGEGGGASAQRSVTVDTTGPAAPAVAPVTGDDIISPLESFAFAVSGSTEAHATVVVSLGNGSRLATADAAGSWTTEPFTRLDLPSGAGFVTLTAVATDPHGNPGALFARPLLVLGSPFAVSPGDSPGDSPLEEQTAAIPSGGAIWASEPNLLASLEDTARHLS